MAERDLGIEMLRLIEEIHPTAFMSDTGALAQATAATADTLGGLFALLRRHAPNEATAQAAMRMMVSRALKFAGDAQTDADAMQGQVAPAYREERDDG